MNRRILAERAVVKALRLRQRFSIHLNDTFCVFDLAEKMGIEVRFKDIPSLEGAYIGEKNLIVLSCLRPTGRKAYTCAHEIGHHVFNHGSKIDELRKEVSERFDPEEYLAECFASYLLMPKTVIVHGFSCRSWDIQSCTPQQVYEIAGWLGVGYSSLIYQMQSLSLLEGSKVTKLLKMTPKKIKSKILGDIGDANLIIVNKFWKGRSVDVEVGDYLILPPGKLESNHLKRIGEYASQHVYNANRQGLDVYRCGNHNWSTFVRISRKNFIGRGIYRHFEDPDNE